MHYVVLMQVLQASTDIRDHLTNDLVLEFYFGFENCIA